MEALAKNLALYISIVVEITATLVIAIALLQFIYKYTRLFLAPHQQHSHTLLRIQFGSSLALALELLLAADILTTAVAPSWDDIGKLAAIAAIRTALNYFLEKELLAIEVREKDTLEKTK